jgi:hypothetical protein
MGVRFRTGGCRLTKIDRWFLTRLKRITDFSHKLKKYKQTTLPAPELLYAKKLGFSDRQIGKLVSGTELGVRTLRVGDANLSRRDVNLRQAGIDVMLSLLLFPLLAWLGVDK